MLEIFTIWGMIIYVQCEHMQQWNDAQLAKSYISMKYASL